MDTIGRDLLLQARGFAFNRDMNRKITALSLQKRNRQRVNVFLDGEFAFGLAHIVAAWLFVGMELSEEKIAELKFEDERETAYQQCLNLISYRPRTAAEIREKLGQKATREEIILYVLERLKNSGLLDDSAFAKTWVENRSELRPRSRRALSYELKQHGVQPEVIEQAIEKIDEEDLAYQAARKQVRKIRQLEWKDFRQKMLRHLALRGFDYETSQTATRRIWEEDVVVERNLDEGEYR